MNINSPGLRTNARGAIAVEKTTMLYWGCSFAHEPNMRAKLFLSNLNISVSLKYFLKNFLWKHQAWISFWFVFHCSVVNSTKNKLIKQPDWAESKICPWIEDSDSHACLRQTFWICEIARGGAMRQVRNCLKLQRVISPFQVCNNSPTDI